MRTGWSEAALPPLHLGLAELREVLKETEREWTIGRDNRETTLDELATLSGQTLSDLKFAARDLELHLFASHATLYFDDGEDRAYQAAALLTGKKPGQRLESAQIAESVTDSELLLDVASPRLTLALLAELVDLAGEDASLALCDRDGRHAVEILGASLSMLLHENGASIRASKAAERLYDALARHRARFRLLTHGDAAIVLGMLAPVLAAVLAPEDKLRQAALVATLPWLAYAIWVSRNADRKWSRVEVP